MHDPAVAPIFVAEAADIPPGRTKKFLVPYEGELAEAFVVNHDGAFHAYLNRCRHLPMTLDWVENQFLTKDGQFILCATHGACFRPDSGACVAGPPRGKQLVRVPLTVEGGRIVAHRPG